MVAVVVAHMECRVEVEVHTVLPYTEVVVGDMLVDKVVEVVGRIGNMGVG